MAHDGADDHRVLRADVIFHGSGQRAAGGRAMGGRVIAQMTSDS